MDLDEIILQTDTHKKTWSMDDYRASPLQLINEDWWKIMHRPSWQYYSWIASLVAVTKPLQIVELGAQYGISALMMSLFLPPEGRVLSVDCDPSWQFVPPEATKIIPISSDSTEFAQTTDFNLNKTDIWFIDTTHWAEQLRKELSTFQKFFKKGALILLDDIHLQGRDMNLVWKKIVWKKRDISDRCHYSGFGIIQI